MSYNDVINNAVSMITSVVELSEYEVNMVKEGLLIITKPLPTTKLSASTRLSEITKCCSDYNYIMTKLRDKRLSIYKTYRPKVDHKFTVLTRQQRPSKEAIMSEIHYTDPELSKMRFQMETIDSALEFLSVQYNVLDKLYKSIDTRQYSM